MNVFARWRLGDRDGAVARLREFERIAEGGELDMVKAARAAIEGDRDAGVAAALRYAQNPMPDPENRYFWTFQLAILGERDLVLKGLREVVDRNFCCHVALETEPEFAHLRDLPEFQKIVADALNFGWDLKRLEADGRLKLAQLQSDMLQAGGAPVLQCIKLIRDTGAKRVVVDPISLYSTSVQGQSELRRELPIVRAHHEKWDGTGYPFGLKGDEIPIGARILSAVDFLDALASDRQYRRAIPLQEVMNRLNQESGKSFDPKVVSVLQKYYGSMESLVKQQAGQIEWSKLSTDLKVERGLQPAAGFANEEKSHSREATFLASIAAARQEAQALFSSSSVRYFAQS
jgi:hypothetical protein